MRIGRGEFQQVSPAGDAEYIDQHARKIFLDTVADVAPQVLTALADLPGSESMVFVPAGSTGDRSEHSVAEADEDMLAALAKSPGGLTTSKWKKACSMPESSFHVRRKCLMERGLVTGGGGRGRPYQISDRGKAVITPTSNITPE